MSALDDILNRFGFNLIPKGQWDPTVEGGEGAYLVSLTGPTLWLCRTKSVTPRGIINALADELCYLEHDLKQAAEEALGGTVDADVAIEEDNAAPAGPVSLESIMDDVKLPLEVEPTWDNGEEMMRLDVRLAEGFLSIWPERNTPVGIAVALAEEFERLAAKIRTAVGRGEVHVRNKASGESQAVA